jgi:hypothetical protein
MRAPGQSSVEGVESEAKVHHGEGVRPPEGRLCEVQQRAILGDYSHRWRGWMLVEHRAPGSSLGLAATTCELFHCSAGGQTLYAISCSELGCFALYPHRLQRTHSLTHIPNNREAVTTNQ